MNGSLPETQYQWQLVAPAEAARFLLHARQCAPFRDLPLAQLTPPVARSFAAYNRWTLTEYLYRYTGRLRIEPRYGYVLTDDWQLVPESLPYYYHETFPTVAENARALAQCPTQREPAVILLRDFGETNYYHFFNDVLAKLAVVSAAGSAADWPLVISGRLAQQSYFQEALARSRALRARRWIVQGDFFIAADCVVFCQAMPHLKRNFDYALELLAAPSADSAARDRIFLTRSPARRRHLRNQAELAAVCRALDFQMVDADELSLREQMELFARARYVVGIHGAGLTNIIFRRPAPLSLLEIFPPSSLPAHYYWLAQHYGFNYRALVGAQVDENGNFIVAPRTLRAQLERLLKS